MGEDTGIPCTLRRIHLGIAKVALLASIKQMQMRLAITNTLAYYSKDSIEQ